MKTTRRAALCALILAFALPVAACGEDDANQFREDYNAAVDRLSKINNDIGAATGGASGQTNKEIAAEFEQIADTAEQTRTDLSELTPPEDAQDEFDRLLGRPPGRRGGPARGGKGGHLERSRGRGVGGAGPVRERHRDHRGRERLEDRGGRLGPLA